MTPSIDAGPIRDNGERNLRALVALVSVVGFVLLLDAFSSAAHHPAWYTVLLAGTVCALGDVAMLHLRFGHDHHSFTWSEIAVVVGMVVLPSPWLRIVGTLSVAAAQLVCRRPLLKVFFNAFAFTIGVWLARMTIVATGVTLRDHSLVRPTTWLALGAASFVFFVWNTVTVSIAVALSQNVHPFGIIRKGLGLTAMVWAGNTAVGVLLVAIAATAPAMLAVLPIVLGLLFSGYRSYLSAMQQRDVWQVLQAASRDLQQVQQDDVAAVVLESLPNLLGAEFVELLVVCPERHAAVAYRRTGAGETEVVDGDVRAIAGSFWPRVHSEAEPFELLATRAPARQAAELRRLGVAMCVVAPLLVREECIGSVRIGFRARVGLRPAELQLLTTFANHVSSAVDNARLFDQIRGERSEFDRILTHSSDGILSVDSDGNVRRWNPAMAAMTGTSASDAIGLPLFHGVTVTTETGAPMTANWLTDRLSATDQLSIAVRLRTAELVERWLELSVARTTGGSHDELAVVVVHDVTERKEFEAQLTHQALHDPLTGLPNRSLFADRLGNALARSKRGTTRTAVLFLDLDRFKVINDSLGHEAGDEVLVSASRRVLDSLREGDTAARFGGDEFVVLCESVVNEGQALAIADRIAQALSAPFDVGREQAFLTVSIGVAISQTGDEDPADLLRDADAAMYLAKERGRNRVQRFTGDMRQRAVARLEVENDLRRAIERSELRLYYQPYVRLEDPTTVAGVEALVRWHHPDRGLVTPAEFIQLAEETGLVQPLGLWVLHEACRQLASWQPLDAAAGWRDCLSINVSPHQLAHDRFVTSVEAAINEWEIEPSRLCLEITESALLGDIDAALMRLYQLRDLGIRLALDDFGTGYSALSYLREVPVEIIKIDRTFVARLDTNARDRAIVAGMIELAHALDLVVIAEGVEDASQADALAALGCDLAQGYLFARPQGDLRFDLKPVRRGALRSAV